MSWNIGILEWWNAAEALERGVPIFLYSVHFGGPANECPAQHFAHCFTALRNVVSRTVETVEKIEKKK
jgi:hypothetical protein